MHVRVYRKQAGKLSNLCFVTFVEEVRPYYGARLPVIVHVHRRADNNKYERLLVRPIIVNTRHAHTHSS